MKKLIKVVRHVLVNQVLIGAENEGSRSFKVQGKGPFSTIQYLILISPLPVGGAGSAHGHAELHPLELPLLGLGRLIEAAAGAGHRAGTRPGLCIDI